MISVYGITDKGKLRKNNQDVYCYGTIGDTQAWGVVCDGMGGASAGEVASRIGAETFRDHMKKYFETTSLDDPGPSIEAAVREGNEAILQHAREHPECSGMGTTLVAAVFQGPRVQLVNIGDSRAYHIAEQKIERVTRDHSFVEALVEKGSLTAEEARRHPQKNLITRALGTSQTVKADIYNLTMQEGDYILLCSDGLSNELQEEEILKELQKDRSLEVSSKNLLDTVLNRGAPDNVTILLFHLAAKK